MSHVYLCALFESVRAMLVMGAVAGARVVRALAAGGRHAFVVCGVLGISQHSGTGDSTPRTSPVTNASSVTNATNATMVFCDDIPVFSFRNSFY